VTHIIADMEEKVKLDREIEVTNNIEEWLEDLS
jgi:hypothetical protein